MGYSGFWKGNPLWQYLIRYDGDPLWETSWLRERLLDWPNPGSQQCCDCVMSAQTGQFAVQYKSFPPYQHFSDSTGNGGDLLTVTDDNWIKAFATQDGGDLSKGLYYFDGPGFGAPADGRVGGWVIAGPNLGSSWNNVVAWIDQSEDGPNHPIGNFSPAWTQYIKADIQIPYAVNGVRVGSSVRSCIVSEHYDGQDPTKATNMEREVYAQWMGLVRWERWDLPDVPMVPGALERAVPFATFTYPNPTINPALILTDCRTWANWCTLPPTNPGYTTQSAGWPTGVILP